MANRVASVGSGWARFCNCSNFQPVHPLYVGINQTHATWLVGEKVENGSVVSILRPKYPEVTGQQSSELFVCLQLGETTCIKSVAGFSDVDVVLHTTKYFHAHYRIDPDAVVLVRPVRTFPLQKVVFGARTRASYLWSKGHEFSTGMLVCSCKQKILAREGDVLLTPLANMTNGKDTRDYDEVFHLCSNLVVLECQPTLQGIITVHTSIVVLPIANDNIDDEKTITSKSETTDLCKTEEPLLLSDFAACLKTIDFTASLLQHGQIQNAEATRTLAKLKSARHLAKLLKTRLGLKPIVLPQCNDFLDILSQYHTDNMGQVDLLNCVGVTAATLQKLNSYNGGWITVQMYSDHLEETQVMSVAPNPSPEVKFTIDDQGNAPTPPTVKMSKMHIANVCVVAEKDESEDALMHEKDKTKMQLRDDSIYLSPLLWFNMQHHPSSLIQPNSQLIVESTGIRPSSPLDCNTVLPFAKSLHIALVKSPSYSMHGKFDTALKKYFSITRLVRTDDVICVNPKGSSDMISDLTENPLTTAQSDCVYYKVVKLEPIVEHNTVYRADVEHTAVYQEPAVNSFIPVTMDAYHSSSLDPIWKSPVPAGLYEYVSKIEAYLMTFLQPRFGFHNILPCILVSGPTGSGKTTVVKAVSRCLNLHIMSMNCHDLCGDTSAATEAKIKNTFHKASLHTPCMLHLRNIDVLSKDKDGTGEDTRVASSLAQIISSFTKQDSLWPLVVIATTNTPKDISADIHSCFLNHFTMEVPSEEERLEILESLCRDIPLARDVSLQHAAKKTAGMVLGDLHALIATTNRSAYRRVVQSCSIGSRLSLQEEKDLCSAGVQMQMKDFDMALDHLQSAHSDVIGAPKVPNITWEDVGGLADVKSEILDTIQLPLQHPELLATGLRRSGVLLYGPPGTGKTLLAKAVATECSLNFLSVKGPELINMYVGQSEENVREVFHRARSARPCVIFFDELDSLAPNRGRSGDSGGVMDRVVSQLLAELDGLHKASDVFVIGATNRPDLLDPALLRPGRFDKLLYLGVSADKKSQLKIIKALTRKFQLSDNCDLEDIVEKCPMNLTGADFYSLCADAMLNAVKRKITALEQEENPGSPDSISVEADDFLTALKYLTPSVSSEELLHYQSIQQQFNRP
ncbi:peroxisomal ATPase PEX6-like [Glandiceps talaboti]